jgi:sortase A
VFDSRHENLRFAACGCAVLLVVASLVPQADLPRQLADTTGHVLAFATVAALCEAGQLGPRGRLARAVVWAAAALSIEVAQALLTSDRVASVPDALASLAGAGAGLLVARVRGGRAMLSAACAVLAWAIGTTWLMEALRPQVTSALLDRAWAQAQRTGRAQAPWPGAPARAALALQLPGTNVPIVIVDADQPTALALAPGLSAQGARFGEQGVVVLLGHRNQQFASLEALSDGATVTVRNADGSTITYVVTGRDIVPWYRSGLERGIEGEHLALVTCWPVDGWARTPLRLVVHAVRVADTRLAECQRSRPSRVSTTRQAPSVQRDTCNVNSPGRL